mmetsp:Transcript_20308/g.36901  ORF Transcript_20308/g.36901 Transcript_20308/m.36901 type:complete len:132 (+) Transcript_20308:448-843(+)
MLLNAQMAIDCANFQWKENVIALVVYVTASWQWARSGGQAVMPADSLYVLVAVRLGGASACCSSSMSVICLVVRTEAVHRVIGRFEPLLPESSHASCLQSLHLATQVLKMKQLLFFTGFAEIELLACGLRP